MRWLKISRKVANSLITLGSIFLCLLLLPSRLPGAELLGIAPNWLLIWVVAWSIKRSVWKAALAGWSLGLLQDGMSAHDPTRALSLLVVAVLTASLQKQRYIQEDFISVALIVFGMSVISETVIAIQFSWYSWQVAKEQSFMTITEVWQYYQEVALASALLSSLWAPVIYYPLNYWWRKQAQIEANS